MTPEDLAVGGCASAVAAGVAGGELFRRLRPIFLTSVNCWFCSVDTSVPYIDWNAFMCAQCGRITGSPPTGVQPRLALDEAGVGAEAAGSGEVQRALPVV